MARFICTGANPGDCKYSSQNYVTPSGPDDAPVTLHNLGMGLAFAYSGGYTPTDFIPNPALGSPVSALIFGDAPISLATPPFAAYPSCDCGFSSQSYVTYSPPDTFFKYPIVTAAADLDNTIYSEPAPLPAAPRLTSAATLGYTRRRR